MKPVMLAAVLALGVPLPASAQVHRSRAPTAAAIREAYLEEVGAATMEIVEQFKHAFQADDLAAYLKLFTPGGLYSPATGESLYGPDAIRIAVSQRMPRFGGMSLTRTDWTASGNLAYLFGRYYYGPITQRAAVEQGTYVMVLLLEGRDWKIRSYVERPDRNVSE